MAVRPLFLALLFSLTGSIFLSSCKDESSSNPQPDSQGNSIEVLTDASALRYEGRRISVSGTVTSKDGFSVKEKGICFGAAALPVIGKDSVLSSGPGFGSFSLQANLPSWRSEWYFRSYAISISASGKTDTTYGNQLRIRPYHLIKNLKLQASGTDSIRFSWDGVSPCRIPGLETIRLKGICWGLSPDPVPGSDNVQLISGNDSLGQSAVISHLQEGKLYYFRAFSATEADTVFGSTMKSCTGLRDIDGNFYPAVVIGGQVWLGANLKCSRFSDGSSMEENPDNARWDSLTLPAWGSSADNQVFGKLYNYHCITSEKNLCPAGWKLPERSDWDSLFSSLGGWEVAGLALKTGTTAWGSSIAEGQGSSGFNALPAGQKKNDGSLTLGGKLGFWWIRGSQGSPQCFRITDLDKGVFLQEAVANQGFSVRCLKRQ